MVAAEAETEAAEKRREEKRREEERREEERKRRREEEKKRGRDGRITLYRAVLYGIVLYGTRTCKDRKEGCQSDGATTRGKLFMSDHRSMWGSGQWMGNGWAMGWVMGPQEHAISASLDWGQWGLRLPPQKRRKRKRKDAKRLGKCLVCLSSALRGRWLTCDRKIMDARCTGWWGFL
jgi:hypothetical protein